MAENIVNNGMTLRDSTPSLFDSFLKGTPFQKVGLSSRSSPPLDIYEEDQNWVVEASVPGYDEDDIDVTLKNDILTIQAEKQSKDETKDQDRSWYRKEISHSKIQRSVKVPNSAEYDPGEIQASLSNGVLTIRIPNQKQIKQEKTKKIQIE